MPAPSIKKVVKLICDDESLRRLAVSAVKDEVDDIFGYSKYNREEIDWGLESRLYSMTYLAKAITWIIKKPEIDSGLKKKLASMYIGLLEPYEENKLPESVYDWGFEPDYTIDIAVFLDEAGGLDWGNHRLLDLVMVYGAGSTVEGKEKFLEIFVDRLNQDEEVFEYYSSTSPRPEEHPVTTTPWDFSPLLDYLRPEECMASPAALKLLAVLSTLISSKHTSKNVSLKALGRLELFTKQDIEWIIDNMLFFNIPNRVKAFEELYSVLMEKGEEPKTLLDSLVTKLKEDRRSKYTGDARVKGLIRAISMTQSDKSSIVTEAEELLDAGVGANARIEVYKFIYAEAGKEEILERARGDNSKKIREWAEDESRKGGL